MRTILNGQLTNPEKDSGVSSGKKEMGSGKNRL